MEKCFSFSCAIILSFNVALHRHSRQSESELFFSEAEAKCAESEAPGVFNVISTKYFCLLRHSPLFHVLTHCVTIINMIQVEFSYFFSRVEEKFFSIIFSLIFPLFFLLLCGMKNDFSFYS